MEGFIYLLRHPDKPEFVKGGKSGRNPFERLKEHNSNGKSALGGFAAVTNKPWEMVAYIPVDNINTAESWLHKKLGKKHNGLELFASCIERAITILLSCPYRTDGKVYIEPEHSEDYAIRSEVAEHNRKLREMRDLFDRVYRQTVKDIQMERANQPATAAEISHIWDRQWAVITGELREQRDADEEARKFAQYQVLAEQKHRARCIAKWQAQLPSAAWRAKQAWRVVAWRALDEAIAMNREVTALTHAIEQEEAQQEAARIAKLAEIHTKLKREHHSKIINRIFSTIAACMFIAAAGATLMEMNDPERVAAAQTAKQKRIAAREAKARQETAAIKARHADELARKNAVNDLFEKADNFPEMLTLDERQTLMVNTHRRITQCTSMKNARIHRWQSRLSDMSHTKRRNREACERKYQLNKWTEIAKYGKNIFYN